MPEAAALEKARLVEIIIGDEIEEAPDGKQAPDSERRGLFV